MGYNATERSFHGGIKLKAGIGLMSSGNGYGLRIPKMNNEKLNRLIQAFKDWSDAKNDYQAAKQLTFYIYDRFEYENISGDRRFVNLIESLRSRKGICKEKAALYQVVAQRLGIDSYYVRGIVDGSRHAWCKVHVSKGDTDSAWADPTWGEFKRPYEKAVQKYGLKEGESIVEIPESMDLKKTVKFVKS